MKQRIAKEFRPLLLPWVIAVVAGAAPLIQMVDRSRLAHGIFETLIGLLFVVSVAGIALLAAMSFGSEFQQRTLPLLLSQPVTRLRIWSEKLVVLLLATALAIGVHLVVWRFVASLDPLNSMSNRTTLVSGTLLFGMACSACFWVLLARSTIGGLAFGAASLFVVVMGANFISEKIFGADVAPDEGLNFTVTFFAAAIYSAVFLWLGWRKFARMEVREESAMASLSDRGIGFENRWSEWLRCRPVGSVRNLFRKEVRLQRPVFLIAGAFAACWLMTLAFSWAQPERESLFATVFNMLTASYITLVVILAGCVSLGEEKTLGLHAWQLTLPVSVRWQWFVKLSVAMTTAFALGVLLPYLLARLTTSEVGLAWVMRQPGERWDVLLPVGLICLLSFWSGALTGNSVRAALTTVIVAVALFFSFAAGVWCAEQLNGVLAIPMKAAMLRFQLTPADFYKIEPGRLSILACIGLVVFIGIRQSLVFYRCSGVQRSSWKFPGVLLLTTFVLTFLVVDMSKSIQQQYRLADDLVRAGYSLQWTVAELESKQPRAVSLEELEQSATLSHSAKVWLRDTSILVTPLERLRDGRVAFRVTVTFPNRKELIWPPARRE
jgi:hypothetical protein